MEDAYELLKRIKDKKPLVHHLTNWVTVYDCANITRAIGALPVMAHAEEEAAEMQSIASALVLNIGTLTNKFISNMILAGKKANELKHPVILDAVGVGATEMRTNKAIEILNNVKVDIIKGNVSEIAKLAGADAKTKGVEAQAINEDPIEVAKKLAKERNATVVITGKEDVITNGIETYIVKNGHEMMSSIVGTGCMATSVIASFAAIDENRPKAAAAALVSFGIAGELAARNARGPASFKDAFYDELYNLDEAIVNNMIKIEKR